MAKSKSGYRVVLHLDLRIALEAILVNRLERIPATRRQEWLRGLLIHGFRSECQALRGAPDDVKPRPTAAFTSWMASEMQKSVSLPASEPAVVKVKPSHANAASKPFAALGKVIG